MINLNPLGAAPLSLGHQTEPLFLLVEDPAGSRIFRQFPWALLSAEVHRKANVPTTAEISLGLGKMPELFDGPHFPALIDWQLQNKNQQPANAWTMLLGGRRMRVQTLRSEPPDDWVLFDGFIGKIALGWSGNSKTSTRTLRVFATSLIAAADRELSQYLFGQWRRSYKAEKLIRDAQSGTDTQECVPSYAMPCIFNPGGRGNCHSTPIKVAADNNTRPVYVFTDPDDSAAVPWNVARMLRYIQWAAVQKDPPAPASGQEGDTLKIYDVKRIALPGLQGSDGPYNWTSYRLAYQKDYSIASGRKDTGPNLDELVAPYIESFDKTGSGAQAAAMLRQLPDVGVDRMTALEAFALVCDQAGLTFYDDHEVDTAGEVHSYLRFVVRGDRTAGESAAGDAGNVNDGAPPGVPPGQTYQSKATTRGVYLYIASDRTADDGSQTPAQLFQATAATEGELTLDEENVRRTALVAGDAVEYEVTTPPLLPGWQYDVNSKWDPDPNDAAAVEVARQYLTQGAGRSLYGPVDRPPDKANIGRYWVLNEDSERWQQRNSYKRPAGSGGNGRWSTDAEWEPFKWSSGVHVKELETRGDLYWPPRRRRFAQPKVTISGRQIDVVVQIQFTTGGLWYTAEVVHCHPVVDTIRGAVWIPDADLTKIVDPTDSRRNYILQYLRKQLSIRLTCVVEGDDALLGWALPAASDGSSIGFAKLYDRRGKMPRSLRYDPRTGGSPIANSMFILQSNYASVITEGNRDVQVEATRLAKRLRDDAAIMRVGGAATIPWLWRDGFGPVAGYRVGDELMGVKTGDAGTFLDFLSGRISTAPLPRIVGVNYKWAESGEHATTLTIEDGSFGTHDAAPPLPPLVRDVPIERRDM